MPDRQRMTKRELLDELARYEDGADWSERDPSAEPTARQLWAMALKMPTDERLRWLRYAARAFRAEAKCFLRDHESYIAHLERRVHELEAASLGRPLIWSEVEGDDPRSECDRERARKAIEYDNALKVPVSEGARVFAWSWPAVIADFERDATVSRETSAGEEAGR